MSARDALAEVFHERAIASRDHTHGPDCIGWRVDNSPDAQDAASILAALAGHGWVLLEVGAIAPRLLDYHPPDGHNAGQGEWQTDAEGYVTEPLVNRGVPHG